MEKTVEPERFSGLVLRYRVESKETSRAVTSEAGLQAFVQFKGLSENLTKKAAEGDVETHYLRLGAIPTFRLFIGHAERSSLWA